MAQKQFLSRVDVAESLAVSPATVSRWARQGRLPCVKTFGGHRRYPIEAIAQLRERLHGGEYSLSASLKLLERTIRRPEHRLVEEAAVVEIRCHGRAGQGLITAGELLAEAALQDGKYFQAFPEFGAERTGAPMEAFVRISPQPIHVHSPVRNPGVVVVFDPTLLAQVHVMDGVAAGGGLLVVNYPSGPEALARAANIPVKMRVTTVDATRIAQETIGRAIPNVPMLGALLRATAIVSPELMADVISSRLDGRLSAAMVEANRTAFWRGYREALVSS